MVWWSKALKSVCQAIGVGHVGYTLGSLRSGGATNHFRRHRNLGYLQYLGRWRSARTLESYLHEAYATLTEGTLPASVAVEIAEIMKYEHWLESPPKRDLHKWLKRLS
jgi:hypothetical protein